MKRTAWGLFLILSAGCASPPRMVYEKPGATPDDIKKDQQACFRTSITGEDQIHSNILKLDRDAYKRCMESRGYTFKG